MLNEGWLVAVDRGGTFTDYVAYGPDGESVSGKVLARSGHEFEEVLTRIGRDKLQRGLQLRVGTTVATNALLTGQRAPTALLVTGGFGDLPLIGHQSRPEIFALNVRRDPPLSQWVVEVDERVQADGTVVREVDREFVRERLSYLRSVGCEVLVVAFAHSVTFPAHELLVEELAFGFGFAEVVLSHRTSPRVGLVDRMQAAILDGALTPVVRRFVERALSVEPEGQVRFMTSDGGLVGPRSFRGRNALLSGPAGGVAACSRLARELSLPAVLGFDMGGTSTDVCRWAGSTERSGKTVLAGRTIPLAGVDVVSVASGGGSRLRRMDGRARVGPESVGAEPGPACYGRGTEASVTDANVLLGRIQSHWFPNIFGEHSDEPLSVDRAHRAVAAAGGVSGMNRSELLDVAAGFVAVADHAMSEAIAGLSLNRGHDPREHALVAMGGAGPQHACSVAELLGIERVLIHPMAGVLSAWGIAGASPSARSTAPVGREWTDSLPSDIGALLARLEGAARASLIADGSIGPCAVTVSFGMRYGGAEGLIEARDREEFETKHARVFGFARPEARIEVLTVDVVVALASSTTFCERAAPRELDQEAILGSVDLHVARGGRRTTYQASVIDRGCLKGGEVIQGPALLIGAQTTVVVDPQWTAIVWTEDGLLSLHLGEAQPVPDSGPPETSDPVGLELYSRRFMGIAERMGETLRKVAWSTNIRERLDFSCAVFDQHGQLIANAPHIPVHLGAMGETVRFLASTMPLEELVPGRSWAVNDPRRGGSHLPDITVVTPVFGDGCLRPFAWVASRGHHADVGGTTPGSMPPFSTCIEEEGILLKGLLLLDESGWRREAISSALLSGDHPCREPEVVQADLSAQVAANRLGVDALVALYTSVGEVALGRWSSWILDAGDDVLQEWLSEFGSEPRRHQDFLDDGTPVVVTLSRSTDAEFPESTGARSSRLLVDFQGTGKASSGNLNAPRAVVRAAVLYVLRCVMGREIPLNEGVLRSVDLRIPKGSLLDPPPGSAVVGGNVETSQRLVDVLFGALGVAAASQGTMNNLCFGAGTASYYETIAGGGGATATSPGADCIQSHMTNTRITDVEVLEQRFPVLVERFARRVGSGGEGRHRGGDGVIRELRFLSSAQVSLLAQRRSRAPFGLGGGESGEVGCSQVTRAGEVSLLPGSFEIRVSPGDCLCLQTPGGGGFGSKAPEGC